MTTKKEATIGHNSVDKRLLGFFSRIERLEEEKKEIADDIKEVYAEAKAVGYDVPTMRNVMRLRRMEPDKRRNTLDLMDAYMAALGMLADTPLGKAADTEGNA